VFSIVISYVIVKEALEIDDESMIVDKNIKNHENHPKMRHYIRTMGDI